MRVNLPSADLAALKSTPAVQGKPAAGTAFADVHAASLGKLNAEVREAGSVAKLSGARATAATGAAKADGATRAPKGETYLPVEGQAYEEITAGPRNGMFVNRSGNARDGEAFVLVKRSGREFHIYGSGANREVVRVDAAAKPGSDAKAGIGAGTDAKAGGGIDTKTGADAKAGASAGADAKAGAGARPESAGTTGRDQAAKRTRYEDVPGRAFDEITAGPRNGMFVNRSGNARDGEAFVLVERARHELHIYGSGKDRLVVRVIPPEKRAEAEPVKPEPAAKTPATGTTPTAGATPGSAVVGN